MTLKDLLGAAYKEGMSEKEIEQALEGKDYIPKEQFDKKTSTLVAEVKDEKKKRKEAEDKLSENLSEQEKADIAEKKAKAELEEKYEALLKKTTIAEYTSNLTGVNFDEDRARKLAEALVEGDMETVFVVMKEHYKAQEKDIRKKVLEETPRPEQSDVPETPKSTSDMSVAEMQEAYERDPEGFKQIINKEN